MIRARWRKAGACLRMARIYRRRACRRHTSRTPYRKKAGKGNVGFVGNFIETCDGEKNLITDYDMQKNTYTDIQFCKDTLNEMPDGGGETGTIIADGAYGSTEILGIAETKKH